MKLKTERIIEPNPEIQALKEKVLREILSLLPDSRVELVGAMSIPMAGRPELDIMAISKTIDVDSDTLVKNGYRQGPVVHGISFLKRVEDGTEIAIQLMSPDNKMIGIHRHITEKLKSDSELRMRYEAFKRTLAGLSREEYKSRKISWMIENALI